MENDASLHRSPIKSGRMGVGTRNQCFRKTSRWFQFAPHLGTSLPLCGDLPPHVLIWATSTYAGRPHLTSLPPGSLPRTHSDPRNAHPASRHLPHRVVIAFSKVRLPLFPPRPPAQSGRAVPQGVWNQVQNESLQQHGKYLNGIILTILNFEPGFDFCS